MTPRFLKKMTIPTPTLNTLKPFIPLRGCPGKICSNLQINQELEKFTQNAARGTAKRRLGAVRSMRPRFVIKVFVAALL